MTDRLKIGQEVLIHGYVEEIRKDIIIIQNEGGYFGTVECEITDIEMPNTNEVLEQLRAEIYEEFMTIDGGVHDKTALKCMEIIDTYKAESEVKG